MEEGLSDGRWLLDISGEVNFVGHMQLLHLNLALSTIIRDPASEDRFSWPADPSGVYTAKSTYNRLCQGTERAPYATCIWISWAILKCKIFAWLAVQHRIWSSDRRARHGLQSDPSACYTCLQDEDNTEHILIQCVYAREVWHYMFEELSLRGSIPTQADTLLDWRLTTRVNFRKGHKRGFDTVIIAATWALWKQRNARVFHRINQQKTAPELALAIIAELKEWRLAGLGVGGYDTFCESVGIG